jgi:hypothetical protein
VAEYYDGDSGYPAWTDSIRWGNVIDMSAYDRGNTNFEKFENARDELAAKGGGVLYYPAGVYDFSEGPFDGPNGRGLMLKSGVVIRGEAPAGKPCAARNGGLRLGTRFVFGFQRKADGKVPRDWNLIGLCPEPGKPGGGDPAVRHVRNVGLCWVHLEGAVVYFGPDFEWTSTWGTAGAWRSPFVKPSWADRRPDGSHPGDPFMGGPLNTLSNFKRDPDGTPYQGKEVLAKPQQFRGCGENRLVFGCVLQDSCLLNDFDTCGRPESPEGFGSEGFHMARYAARIAAYGSRVLVANNALPESTERCFAYDQTTVKTRPGRRGNDYIFGRRRRSLILFDYNRVMGVDVNKSLLACMQAPLQKVGQDGYFAEGIVVRDNHVFNHGNKGFDLAGKWMTLRDNHNKRAFLRGGAERYGVKDWRLTLDGFVESSPGGGGMISDNYARAFDLAGRNIWVHGNRFGNLGSWPGNDGEAISIQYHNGTHWMSWAVTHNRNTAGKKGFIFAYACDMLGALIAWNKAPHIGKGSFGRTCDAAFVENDTAKLVTKGTPALTESPPGTPPAPGGVEATLYGKHAIRISWTDAADNEIGFRVDRRVDGGDWHCIAYRPPQIECSPENPREWIDWLAPPDRDLQYRVVAITDKDDGGKTTANQIRLPAVTGS